MKTFIHTHTHTHTHTRQLRSSTDRSCSVPRTYSTSGHRSFAAAGTRVWNSLPSNLRDEKLSFQSFRRLLKTHWFTANQSAMWTIIYCAIEIHVLTDLHKSKENKIIIAKSTVTRMAKYRLQSEPCQIACNWANRIIIASENGGGPEAARVERLFDVFYV